MMRSIRPAAILIHGLASLTALSAADAQRSTIAREMFRARADSLVFTYLADSRAPSAAFAVIRGNDTLAYGAHGLANIEAWRAPTATTIYQIGSITKQFTSAAVMKLVEQGRVKLDDDLVNQDKRLRPLLEKFVCVRVVSTNGLDLSLFQFDYDQSFAAFLLNADGTVYGRFGTRSHRTSWSDDVSIEGLAQALKGGLELHERYPKNKAGLAGKKGPAPAVASPHAEGVEGAHAGAALEIGLMAVALAVAVGGIVVAGSVYLRRSPPAERIASASGVLYPMVRNLFWVDELYEIGIVRPFYAASRVFGAFDRFVVDGLVNLTGTVVDVTGQLVKLFQTGYVRNYALLFLMGALAILAFLTAP